MNKKGFTLIELLAVILILGIIALIAIPTVSAIIEQVRKSAFETTVNNLIIAAETKCNMELIEGNGITKKYVITNGVIDHPLDVKGELPQSATIYVSDNCVVRIYAQNDKYYTSNDNDEGEFETIKPEQIKYHNTKYFDYVKSDDSELLAVIGTNGHGVLYHDPKYASKIISVSTVFGVPNEKEYISWDFSEKNDGSVIAWLEPNGDNYDLFIGSKGKIRPVRTTAWFGMLDNLVDVNFDNIDTSETTTLSYMFSGCKSVKKLDLSKFNLSNANYLSSSFNYMDSLEEVITSSSFAAPNLISLGQAFRKAKSLTKLDLSNLVTGTMLDTIGYAFEGCDKLKELDISGLDISNVEHIEGLLNNDKVLEKVYVKNNWKVNASADLKYVSGVPSGEAVFIKK